MPWRYQSRGEADFYYVFNSSYQNETIFRSPEDYRKFVGRIRQLSGAGSAVRVVAYSINRNSFHMVLKEDRKGSIADFVHKLSVSYAMYHNSRYKVKGRVFRGPYKELALASDHELLDKIAQLHKMPLLYQSKPEKYLWTSYRSYIRGNSTWLFMEPVIDYFNSVNFAKAIMSYTDSVPLSE